MQRSHPPLPVLKRSLLHLHQIACTITSSSNLLFTTTNSSNVLLRRLFISCIMSANILTNSRPTKLTFPKFLVDFTRRRLRRPIMPPLKLLIMLLYLLLILLLTLSLSLFRSFPTSASSAIIFETQTNLPQHVLLSKPPLRPYHHKSKHKTSNTTGKGSRTLSSSPPPPPSPHYSPPYSPPPDCSSPQSSAVSPP